MDDINECYNAWKVTLDMIKDRGYKFPENTDYEKVDFNSFKELFNDKNCDILAITNNSYTSSNDNKDTDSKKNNQKKLYVKFILTPKIKPAQLREYFDDIMNTYITENDEFIVILRTPVNTPIEKLNKEKKYKHIQIFWTHILQYNPTKHYLVPLHTKCNDDEVNELLSRYRIEKKQLPSILRDDPIVRYYNFQVGDVICVKRRMNNHYLHVV
jgi:DNA-directed RNA polymerase subunit H (RpoH/RPB5)